MPENLTALLYFREEYLKACASAGSICVKNHKNDLVGNWWIVGNNPDSGLDTNNLNRNWVQTIADIFSNKKTSSHNCYGLGQPQCVTDGYRNEGDLIMHKERPFTN